MTCDQCQRPINYCFYIPDEFWLKTVGTNKGHKCAHCVLEQLGGLDWLIIWNEPAEKMRVNTESTRSCAGCGKTMTGSNDFGPHACSRTCEEAVVELGENKEKNMTIGDDGVASICMGKEHVGNPCERCGLEEERPALTTRPVTEPLPEWEECKRRLNSESASREMSPLEAFVYNYEPAADEGFAKWRSMLIAAINASNATARANAIREAVEAVKGVHSADCSLAGVTIEFIDRDDATAAVDSLIQQGEKDKQ